MTTHNGGGHAARALLFLALALGALAAAGCSSGGPRRLLFSETSSMLGSHRVTVRPVGRWHSDIFAGPQQDADGKQLWLFTVGQTKLVIKDEQLTVNDKAYGKLKEGDRIDVHRGKVFINDKEAAPATPALASN